MKVIREIGYGIFILEDGKRYIWDFAPDGIEGVLISDETGEVLEIKGKVYRDEVVVEFLINQI